MDTSAEPRRSSRVTPAQVIALGLVAASIGWAAWVLRDRPASEEVELLPGTVLPSSELAIVEAAFDRAQLTGHRTEDGRVWVSRPRQSAYMRALVDAEALPREFGSSLRRALESNSPWQSRAAQEELLRVAVQEELAHVICSMPGIERAAVLYDVNDRAAFDGTLGGGPARTASVNVRTQLDVELEPSRVQAIRVLVAASIAGLEPERVAVTDLRSGRVHAGPLEPVDAVEPPSTADPALARQIAHERHLAAKVRQGLAFVKGAVIDVTVSFADDAAPPPAEPNLPPRQQRVADANAPAEVALVDEPPPAPVHAPSRDGRIDSIVVSVAVPETWFEAAVRAARQRDVQMAAAEVDRREEERIRGHVLELLPSLVRTDARRVVITRFPVVSSRPEPPPRPHASASVAAPPAAGTPAAAGGPAAKPRTLGGYVDVTIKAVSEGRLGDVPREVWMAFTAKCSAILAYILFRSGSRSEERQPRRRQADADRRPSRSRIDWTAVDEDDSDDEPASPPRRMAA
jgi:type III secretory pathway lipoprotein EscJ